MTGSLRIHGPTAGGRGDYTLACAGTLDGSTYRELRDVVIKAALDEPPVVIVDVDALRVPAESAWSVFTSARWHVSTWPDIPIVLVCADTDVRDTLRRNGITRYVPVYRTVHGARTAYDADEHRRRQRARAQLPAVMSSSARARRLVEAWLTSWSRAAMIPLAATIASELVENVLLHTDSEPALILECDGDRITVAVEDASPTPAQRTEHPRAGTSPVSGLAVVAALSRTWGSIPTLSGKTVWAVIGPENVL
ncbi:Stas domain-containing protein [Mycolicibacterium canariasense]|uniref:Stas domain-containing protein n=1 Tax=Mycolicibacterium canariasense TaxID=228230 RepID=A0A124E2P8_MYCCR|nr:STAS domain-containing protein [Mycolicibacterium canariasense]MCV7210729.1 STAS domain-containing protein [Mycolicibacterium canariasense]ORU98323.1 sulfate transporter [Mycolicibacterium canariasense]GAS97504.1 Stas domain-containing protein [Mycolicibacterium canariasense]